MNTNTANQKEPAPKTPSLATLLYRNCLAKNGSPADHARGLLADLRKLLSPATRNQGIFALGKIGARDAIGRREMETLAAIFAISPHRPEKRRNFGETCRALARRNNKRPGDSPFDAHFRRILASRTLEDLLDPLVSAARLAKTADVPIDHQSLEWDLKQFRHDPDKVLENWAKSYFDTRKPTETQKA